MRTMLNYLKYYIEDNYGIIFKINDMNWLEYKNGKKEYNLHCDFAYHPEIEQRKHFWSIYYDFMDYKEWSGYGGTYIDEGHKTIDRIMADWGFKKKEKQTSIYDFLGR